MNKNIEPDQLAELLHRWYLEAVETLPDGSYNAEARKSYENLSQEQKKIDRYIAERICELFKDRG